MCNRWLAVPDARHNILQPCRCEALHSAALILQHHGFRQKLRLEAFRLHLFSEAMGAMQLFHHRQAAEVVADVALVEASMHITHVPGDPS